MLILSFSYFRHIEHCLYIEGEIREIMDKVVCSGSFTEKLYDEMLEKLDPMGIFTIGIVLERQLGPGVCDTYWHREDIIGKELRAGDLVTLSAGASEEGAFSRLAAAVLGGTGLAGLGDVKWPRERASCRICIPDTVKKLFYGYEVIAAIADELEGSQFLAEPPAVHVVTAFGDSERYYGSVANPYLESDNLYYGDDPEEAYGTGISRIHDYALFLREIEYYPDGAPMLIRFIMQMTQE
ncbi:MAG: hypothetical protein PHG48_02240 [Eubacteriales bacterium]|nr:hypothetical protein [Eubacteriales bacterium]